MSQENAWLEWIRFFLRGVAEQSADAAKRCTKLLRLWQKYRAKMQDVHAPALSLKLVDQLFTQPLMTVRHAQEVLGGVAYPTAKNNLDKLAKAGIVKRERNRQGTYFYIAKKILQRTD